MARYIGQTEEVFYVEVVNEQGFPVEDAEIYVRAITEAGNERVIVPGVPQAGQAKKWFPFSEVFGVRSLSLHASRDGYEPVFLKLTPETQLVGRTFRLVLRRPVLVRVGVPLLGMAAFLGMGTVLFGKAYKGGSPWR